MRTTLSVRLLSVLPTLLACGCRSGEGSAAGEISLVASDVALRTGTTVAASADDASVAAACQGLLARPLTQESAVKVALLNNPSVREAYERLGIARADLLQAGLVSNPVFTASAKFFSGGPEIELGLAQSFVDLFFMPLRRRVASADLCAAEAAVARELVHLVYDVRRALVAVHAADRLVAGRAEAQRVATTSRDLMRKLHDAGNVNGAQWTVAETAAARAELDWKGSEALAREVRERTSLLLGLGAGPPDWKTEPGLADPPDEIPDARAAEARAVAASLDLLESCARIESAGAKAGLVVRQGRLPMLDLGPVAKRESTGPWGVGPQVSTALPLFDQGQARALEANATLRGRIAHHEALTSKVRSAARRFAARVSLLSGRAKYFREQYLPLRERLVQETLKQYNAMQIGAFEALAARQQAADAQREYAETLREAWWARLDLAELLSGSLDEERLDSLKIPEATPHPAVEGAHGR